MADDFVGKYPLEKLLGKGGMGEVWLSHHPGLDIPVAVKILKDFESESQLNRFIQEGRIAASINHDNIVRVYDADSDGDRFFIVMEFIKGQDYKEFAAKNGGRLTVEQGLELGMTVCSALSKAHQNKIFHRDIKPENIMRSESGEIKLADLGIAKREDSDFQNTIANTPLGTPYYISPEQAYDASTVDCRTDIYSLGATLYYLLTGTYPFKANTPMQMMMKHINESLDEPVKRNPAIPPVLSDIIVKMMEKDREKRFQTCEEVQEELAKFESTYNPEDFMSETAAAEALGATLGATVASEAETLAETMDSSEANSSEKTLDAAKTVEKTETLTETVVDDKNSQTGEDKNTVTQGGQENAKRPTNFMPFYVSLAVIFLMFVIFIFKDKLTGSEENTAQAVRVNNYNNSGGGTDVLQPMNIPAEPEIPSPKKELPPQVEAKQDKPKKVVPVQTPVTNRQSTQDIAKEEVRREIQIALGLLESGNAMEFLQRYSYPSDQHKYGLRINTVYLKWFRKYQEKMYSDILKEISSAKTYFADASMVSYKVSQSFTAYLKKAGVYFERAIPDPPMYINFVKYHDKWFISDNDSDPLVKDHNPVYDELAEISAMLKNRKINELLQRYTHPNERSYIPEYQELFQDENYYLLYTALSLCMKRMSPAYSTQSAVFFKINESMYLSLQKYNGKWYVMDSEEGP
ncbi:MAG: serine/threonine protein kinase [Lentisphaeraceae bacterium]|nr:serine/threonine protein kinase [Lentisphaeraceae bacterium]